MRCPTCKRENLPNARFCGGCGTPVAAPACPACGWSLQPEDKFCPGCGHRASAGAPSAPLSTHEARAGDKPISYIPGHLAERILTARATIEGERKQATVLFADIVDSTRLTYGKDPEEADDRLSPTIDAMRTAVFRYEGYARPRGDGIQALFGVPLAQEDHAIRGCYAALDILEAISELNKELREQCGEFVQVRVGLNSGEVLIKSIRDDLLLEVDVMGSTVALASRMQDLTLPGTIQMTAATLALAEGFVQAESRGPIPVRGIDEPVEVFQLEAARPGPTRFHGIAARGLTRFVGRALEMETLARAWGDAARGHGQVVAFVGEPGVGKSRLFWEFIHSKRTRDALVLEAGSVSYGKATPYLPVIDLVRQYFEVQPSRDERRIKEKISSKLVALDQSLLSFRPALFALLGLQVEDREWLELDPVQRRVKTLAAVTGIVLREAQARPVCLVFENLHWIDLETEAVLGSIVESLPVAPIILLVNYRPEYESHWTKKTYFTQLPMGPLPEESAEALLDALLGTDDALSPLKEKLFALTEGNPFFLEESVQTLKEQSIVSGERGKVRLMQPVTEIEVPASVQSTLEARIDRLDPDHKHLLHYASVIGKIVPFAVLREAVDVSEDALGSGLAQLQASEFLYETKLYPDREYTFKHALTYQVAYLTLPQGRRRSLHSRIMQAMEQVFAHSQAEHIEQLAHHAFRGAVWDKAVWYFFEAGKKSYDRSANREAADYLEKALEALRNLPESEETLAQAVDIRFVLRLALLNLGKVERISRILDETRPLVDSLKDPARTGQFEAFLCNHFFVTGNQVKAIEHGRRALEIAEKSDNFILKVEMAFRLGQTFYQVADFQEARRQFERGLAILGPDRDLDRLGLAALPAVMFRAWLALGFAELGEFALGVKCGTEAVDLAERARHPLSAVIARWGLGGVHMRRCDYPRALIEFERGLDICKRWSLRNWFPRLASSVGIARALTGRHGEAISLLEDAIRTVRDTQHSVDEPLLFRRLAFAHLLMGEHDKAERQAHRALEVCLKGGARGQEALTRHLLGAIHSHSRPPDWGKASAYYHEALDLAGMLGMRPLALPCHEGIARVYREQGRKEEAEDAIQAASSISHELEIHSESASVS